MVNMCATGISTILLCGCYLQAAAEQRTSLIAYTKFAESGPEIWLVDEFGKGARQVGPGSDASGSLDDRRLAFTMEIDGNVDVYYMDLDATNVNRLTNDDAEDSGASWSPDGSMIAFDSNRSGSDQVWRSNVDAGEWGYNLTQLTEDTHDNQVNNFLSWSPDGRWIAFEADRDRDDPEIYLANAVDGSNQQRLTFTRALDEVPSWSPSGAEILFSSNMHGEPQSRTYDIYIMGVDGSAQRRLTTTSGAASYPSMSADGKKIVYSYQSGEEDTPEIWVMNADGSDPKRLLEDGGIPRFSPF